MYKFDMITFLYTNQNKKKCKSTRIVGRKRMEEKIVEMYVLCLGWRSFTCRCRCLEIKPKAIWLKLWAFFSSIMSLVCVHVSCHNQIVLISHIRWQFYAYTVIVNSFDSFGLVGIFVFVVILCSRRICSYLSLTFDTRSACSTLETKERKKHMRIY